MSVERNRTYALIGGPKHGEIFRTPHDEPWVTFPVLDEIPAFISRPPRPVRWHDEHYRREHIAFQVGEGDISTLEFMAHESLKGEEAGAAMWQHLLRSIGAVPVSSKE